MFAECHICDTRQTLSMPSAASLALGKPRICRVPDLALGIRRPPTLSRTTHTRTHNTHTHMMMFVFMTLSDSLLCNDCWCIVGLLPAITSVV